ncbi:MAG TPA: hypothetical protein VJP77_09350, partial [Planctomycetota bacterium]|nr:hypothetical protein [Planctomycetota bacterium]
RLWAVAETPQGFRLHRSDDAGWSWAFVTDVDDYWRTLEASAVDPGLCAWGGVEVHRTANGGASFAVVNTWGEYYGDPAGKLHADVPGLDLVPDGAGGETWYVATDGGLYRSTDGLESVQNLSQDGLRVSQYYTTLTSPFAPDQVVAGAQDQGYQRATTPPDGSGLVDFDQLISGDYGHAVSTDGSHDFVFSVYPGFLLVQKGAVGPKLYTFDFPAGDHSWMPSLAADPTRKDAVFFCGSKLWRYQKTVGLNVWVPVQHSAQDFAVDPGEHLTAVAFSPLVAGRAYATTNRGRLWRSADHGVTWLLSPGLGPGPHYFYGTALLASATDPDVAWVGG